MWEWSDALTQLQVNLGAPEGPARRRLWRWRVYFGQRGAGACLAADLDHAQGD